MRSNLFLHCGANLATAEDVAQVFTPDATDTHFPLPHANLLDTVYDALDTQGLVCTNAVHALNRDGAHYFGLLEVSKNLARDEASGWNSVIGLRNSHDKSFAADLVCGSRVFVCDNLAFSGEVRLTRKHTKSMADDLPKMVADALAQLAYLRIDQETRITHYKGTPIDQATADHILLELFRAKAMPIKKLGKAHDEFVRPSHPEFLEGGHTAWTLFNAATEALKGSGLAVMPARTITLHEVLDRETDLMLPGPKDWVEQAA